MKSTVVPLRTSATVTELPVTLDCRIRAHLAQLDRVKEEEAQLKAVLADEGRRLADAHRRTLRYSIDELRILTRSKSA